MRPRQRRTKSSEVYKPAPCPSIRSVSGYPTRCKRTQAPVDTVETRPAELHNGRVSGDVCGPTSTFGRSQRTDRQSPRLASPPYILACEQITLTLVEKLASHTLGHRVAAITPPSAAASRLTVMRTARKAGHQVMRAECPLPPISRGSVETPKSPRSKPFSPFSTENLVYAAVTFHRSARFQQLWTVLLITWVSCLQSDGLCPRHRLPRTV